MKVMHVFIMKMKSYSYLLTQPIRWPIDPEENGYVQWMLAVHIYGCELFFLLVNLVGKWHIGFAE